MEIKSKRKIWLDGKFVTEDQAKANVMSPTFQYGINVFEGTRCYYNEKEKKLFSFRLNDHLERLYQSLKLMRLSIGLSENEIIYAYRESIQANKYQEDIAVRLVCYIDGAGNWAYKGSTKLLIAPIAMGRAFPDRKGISAHVSSWKRIDDNSIPPRMKVGANYVNSRMAQLDAIEKGADVAIFLNSQGNVSESVGSCVFLVKQGKLITSPVTASILESITRDTVIKLAKEELGLEVCERDVDKTELYVADEVFLCGTAVEIVPILRIDGYIVGDGEIGNITNSIQKLYFKVVRGTINKYKMWLQVI